MAVIGDRRFSSILDWIYPRACLGCKVSIKNGTADLPLCADCKGEIRFLSGPCCPVCATPFSSSAALSHSPKHRCGECRENPPFFSQAITPYAYEGGLAKTIRRFKYQKGNQLAMSLASLLVDALGSRSFDLVTPIPLHPTRLREREFNQSLLLADRVAQQRTIPLLIEGLERLRETGPQVGLSRKEREKNVRRAFRVSYREAIQGKRILLVDDVYTTGATLREGAKTLAEGGAKEIVVAAVARMI
ncbi:MAG: ComF family protein [Candidatus Manganitrophaceae bacterium]